MAMLFYRFALFLHIVGAFGLIAAVTLEAIGLRGLRHATQGDEARMWLGISRRLVSRLAPASLGVILLTGLLMTATAWGPQGWIAVALGWRVRNGDADGPPGDGDRACPGNADR